MAKAMPFALDFCYNKNMLRIAIIEDKENAKELMYVLYHVLQEEFSYVHFLQLSKFMRVHNAKDFDILILKEAYNNVRVWESLELGKNNTVVIYCAHENEVGSLTYHPYSRCFTLRYNHFEEDLSMVKPYLMNRMNTHKDYYFSYNGVRVLLKIHDIAYIEKDEKDLVFHTKKGLFRKRDSIAKLADELKDVDFIRIHSGIIVNYEYIFQIQNDEVELIDHTILPISRSRKSELIRFVQDKNGG